MYKNLLLASIILAGDFPPKIGNKAKTSTLTILIEPVVFKWKYHLTFLVYRKECILVIFKERLHSEGLYLKDENQMNRN